jgi:hypothetical protein
LATSASKTGLSCTKMPNTAHRLCPFETKSPEATPHELRFVPRHRLSPAPEHGYSRHEQLRGDVSEVFWNQPPEMAVHASESVALVIDQSCLVAGPARSARPGFLPASFIALVVVPIVIPSNYVCAFLGESDKSLLALGRRKRLPVVIKVLRSDEGVWRAKFAHGVRLARLLPSNRRFECRGWYTPTGTRYWLASAFPARSWTPSAVPVRHYLRPHWRRCWTPSPPSPNGDRRVACTSRGASTADTTRHMRARGLIPRNNRHGNGRGRGSVVTLDPGALPAVLALARPRLAW